MVKLTLLGTGSFFVTKERSSSAFLLEADGKKILLDCGPGTLMRLSQLGERLENIDYVFITHFHPDHTSDLFAFFMNFRLAGILTNQQITKYPKIIGPKGIDNFLLKLSKDYQLLSVEGWEKIKFIQAKKQQKIGKIKIESFKVKHSPFGLDANALAYRFTIGGKIITFSGDCVRCPGIEKASRNADIFVCDTSYAKGQGSPAHMDTYDIAKIAKKSNVKQVVLTHFYPKTNNVDLVEEVKEKFSGKVVRGEDFMILCLK